MSIYDELNIKPFINAHSPYTRFGGAILPQPVVDAMVSASRHCVNIHDLQTQVGRAIAEMTRNDAAYVSCGAASGIMLSIAALIAGVDPALADRLPDTTGLKNQVLMPRRHLGTEADAAIRAAGGRIVTFGTTEEPSESDFLAAFQAALSDQIVAVFYIAWAAPLLAYLPRVISIARERAIPVIVDGAGFVPPRSNLWHFTRDLGATAFITSGGKGIRGPQSTGLVLGSQSLIDGCTFHGSPNLRIGRTSKVGKEEFAGIYAAVKLLLSRSDDDESREQANRIDFIVHRLSHLPHLTFDRASPARLDIVLDEAAVGMSAVQAARQLLESTPSILVISRSPRLSITSQYMQDGEEHIVAKALSALLTRKF
jgi:seryl-tRNA(Sec) selenium transferase